MVDNLLRKFSSIWRRLGKESELSFRKLSFSKINIDINFRKEIVYSKSKQVYFSLGSLNGGVTGTQTQDLCLAKAAL